MKMEERGCIYHKPRDWVSLKGMPCISYCNKEFLENIAEIKKYVRCTIWVNCMCWLFDKEKAAHQSGLIDYFVYQTDHARLKVQDELIGLNPKYNWAKIVPYFDVSEFPLVINRPKDKFRFCRVSRNDSAKFNKFQWWIYNTMTAPVLKEGIVLGYNEKAKEKIGSPPNWVKALPAGAMSVHDVYGVSDCFIMASDTYENLPRVGFEAMASGCLLIVDNRGGWAELVQHNQTGFLCSNEREFVYYATRAAFEPEEREMMCAAARSLIEYKWGMTEAIREWGNFLAQL